MGKKRRTKQEKIIRQLKRELIRLRQGSGGQAKQESSLASASTKPKPRQEAISPSAQARPKKPVAVKKADNPIFFYPSSLVKKDLLKTLALTLIILASELVLYWKLR